MVIEVFAYSLIVILIAAVVFLGYRSGADCRKALDQLMLFHEAGRSIANHQLQMAQIETEKRRTELEIKRLEMERSRAGAPKVNSRIPMTASAGSGVDV